ncbi:MAG: glutaredoxin family protein [Gammaproteobacteria bacterium]|nr:glutaredoxin family protein [Gammaproteobacteria bacterium]
MLAVLAETLAAVAPALADSVAVIDVDADATLQRRYGLKVPVLLLDGEPVCHGHLDAAEVVRLLRGRGTAGA